MYATSPVDHEDDLAGLLVDIHHYLADERSQETLLCTLVRLGIIPQGFQIARKILELINRADGSGRRTFSFDADTRFDYSNRFQGGIPTTLELLRHEAIVRICCLVLPLSASCAVACCLEITP